MVQVLARCRDSKQKMAKVEDMDVLNSCCIKGSKVVLSSLQNSKEKSDENGGTNISSLSTNPQSRLKVLKTNNSDARSDRDFWIKNEIGIHLEPDVKTLKRSHLHKPQLSYIALISSAIQSSGNKRMLLSDIYEWIVNNFPSFKMANRSWRNSVRHNLSLNECFVKCGRCDSGKGHYWGIHAANREDFAKGDYRRRHARRLVKKCDELAKLFETDATNPVSQKPGDSMTSQCGYAVMTCTTVSNRYLVETFGAAVLSTNGHWRPKNANEICEKHDLMY